MFDVTFFAMGSKMPPRTQSPWLPYLLLTLTVLFWSGNFVLGRGIRDLVPPVTLNFYRWLGALVILLPFGLPRIRRQWPLVRRHWKMLALMSIPSISIFNTFIYTALQASTTTNTVLLNALVPIFIGVLAWAIFGVRLGAVQALGVFVSLAGLVFIITQGDLRALGDLDFSGGDFWTLSAGVSWALYSVLLRLRPVQMEPLTFLTAIVILGLVFLLPFYAWERTVKGGFEWSPATLAAIGYVCLFPSVLAYIFWNRGVELVGPNRAGLFFHLMPVFSILLAVALLGERLHGYHFVGMGMIFTGIVLNSRK
jgi:drug/metabolite transporter (DMT)-like permease